MNDASKTRAHLAFDLVLINLQKAKEADPSIRENFDGAPDWDSLPQYAKDALDKSLDEVFEAIDSAPTDDQGYGQIGYQAYVAFTGGLNYRGEQCPLWADLPEKIRGAWGAAATSVRSEHEHRNAPDFDLEVSKEELAELVAGLDALQRAGGHEAEVAFPLRARLRAVLFPPAPEPEAPAEEAVGEAPQLESGEVEASTDLEPPKLSGSYDEYKAAAEASLPLSAPPAAGPEGEAEGGEATKPINAAPESPNAEADRTAPATEPSPPGDASEGGVVLPSVSGAPAGPGFPELPEIPGPPPMPTDIGAPPAPPPAEPPADGGSES